MRTSASLPGPNAVNDGYGSRQLGVRPSRDDHGIESPDRTPRRRHTPRHSGQEGRWHEAELGQKGEAARCLLGAPKAGHVARLLECGDGGRSGAWSREMNLDLKLVVIIVAVEFGDTERARIVDR